MSNRANTEDNMILEFLSPIEKGFFVEVGANHPTNISATYSLEQLGWQGVLIEPLPECCQLIREHRKAKLFECACGAPDDPSQMSFCVAEANTFSALKGRSVHASSPDLEITVTVRINAIRRHNRVNNIRINVFGTL